jgi:hypothetical protein
MAIGAILGIASAGLGMMGATGQHNAEVDRVNAENRYRRVVYKQELDNWNRKNIESAGRYETSKAMYQQQLSLNAEGAARANFGKQRALNQLYSSNKLKEQASGIQQAQAMGQVNAREVSGKSQDRLRGSTLAAFGRNQAIRQQNLMNARQETAIGMQDTTRQLNQANSKAFNNVMFRPTFTKAPIAPMMQKGPSTANLYASYGSSILGGISTASSLTAPGQGINGLLGIS